MSTTDQAISTTINGINDRASSDNGSLDLAELIAYVSTVDRAIETSTRQDNRARELATIELARYEALLADKAAAEQAVTETRRVLTAAEQLAQGAFSEEARLQSIERAASLRVLELRGLEFISVRTRMLEELERSPGLAHILAEQRRRDDEEQRSALDAEAARARRLAEGIAAIDRSLSGDDLDGAQRMQTKLEEEFADDAELRRRSEIIRWRMRRRLAEPAEDVLRGVTPLLLRDEPERVMTRLARIETHVLPENIARRVFGLWSNACVRAVEQRGWYEPRRAAPMPSRGVVWARPQLGGPYQVVSSLNTPQWQAGQTVPEQLARRAPLLRAASSSAVRTA